MASCVAPSLEVDALEEAVGSEPNRGLDGVGETISPELALVDPQLADRARARLPEAGRWAPGGAAVSARPPDLRAKTTRGRDHAARPGASPEPWFALLPHEVLRAVVLACLLLTLLAVARELVVVASESSQPPERAKASAAVAERGQAAGRHGR